MMNPLTQIRKMRLKSKKSANAVDPADLIDDEPPATEPLDEHEKAELRRKLIASVRHRAVGLLARREHGRSELRDKLIQRDLPVDAIEIALDDLAARGLQCDVRFAESYTRMRVNRGFGPNKVRADLQLRKLTREVIEDAISENDANWSDNAYNALLKKFGDPDNHFGRVTAQQNFGSSASDRARMQRFLHSRGYNPSDISSAINRVRQRVN